MNDITIFNHLGNDIRVMTDEQGEPLFVLKDVCDALELGNPSMVAGRLDSDWVSTTEVTDNLGRSRTTNVVTEAGLYEVIFMSRKPEAAQFRRWVTSEVLPSIRKRGGYLTPEATREALRDPDFIIQLAMDLKEERAARAKAEAEVEAQRPVAALGRAIETAEGDLTPSAFGKVLSKTIKDMGPTSSAAGSSTTTSHSATGKARSSPCRTL
nr:MAG TPA: repressor domain protein [Caudoviricetes sp.]